ncbi:MAG TPA: ATP-binding protein [Pyrinomonadaceae bacterium]|jgi:two-component system chemotaxis sensor kinase CheA
MDQLLREFLAEAEDLIEMLVGDLQALRARASEGRARRELTARIFRHVHTIKGTASAAELDVTSQIAHEFETLLDGVRLGRIAVSDAVLDAFEDSAAAIAQSLNAVSRGLAPSTPFTLIERLRRLTLKSEGEKASETGATTALAALPEEIARSLSEYEQHRLREAAAEDARLFIVTVNFDLATFDERFRDFSDALAEVGELISTLPGLDGGAADQINFRIVYATAASLEEVTARVTPFGAATFKELSVEEPDAGASVESEEGGEPLFEGQESQATSIASLTSLVRVELSELDEMVSAAHELLTDTTDALDLSLSSELTRSERTEMEIRSTRIQRRFVELEERLIGMRMIPIAQTLARAARAGVMAARATGKEVDFETRGGDVRLDKSLADAISDPLLHLLRNAVDHGIESMDERTSAGKPARGRVLLEAVAEGSRVRLRVEDDGRGIDTKAVARAALERGIVERGESLTREQSLRLIFRPGFSTAASISNTSGRGVGLDVVEHGVEQVGGELRIWSEPGAGTTFEMTLPTTLALVPALVVRSAGYQYCVDAGHIIEAGFIDAHEVERIGDQLVIRWRGALLPLVHMRRLLAQPASDQGKEGERVHIIISHVAGHGAQTAGDQEALRRAAVAVDGWDGHHEVLVRGLGRYAARWRGIGGAAEMPGGAVALVLDLPRLLEMAL